MNSASQVKAALVLMRPAQWPILTVQLAVGVLLAMPADGAGPSWRVLFAAWLAWVVMLNGGTLAFNSAYDRDTGPVAYLARPPAPPRWLAGVSLGTMLAGAALGFSGVGRGFGAVTAACVLLSILYSHPRARWKSRPGLDLAVNMRRLRRRNHRRRPPGRGAVWGSPAEAAPAGLLAVLGFALLFGAFYPVTQIYQRDQDLRRGDRTLVTALGPARALRLAVALSAGGAASLLAFLVCAGRSGRWYLPAAALAAWMVFLARWERKDSRLKVEDQERAMYRALWLWALIDAALVAAWLA